MIDLEESYYSLDGHEYVKDCGHGVGEQFAFIHDDRKWAFTIYHHSLTVSLLDITEDSKNETL